jgi:hypothetical protein
VQPSNASATPIVAPSATLGDLAAIMADLTREHPEAGHRVQHGAFLAIMGHADSDTRTGWWVASERDASVQYLVLPAHQSCTCQDAARHGSLSPCKHLLCVETIARLERLEADAGTPIDDEPCGYWLTDAALELLGELPDLTPQCPRCHAEPALLDHLDHLGPRCLADELFGTDPRDGVA